MSIVSGYSVCALTRISRHYPQAVYNRIAGIMLEDEAVSPWPSPEHSNNSP
jgi:hypothetical protein